MPGMDFPDRRRFYAEVNIPEQVDIPIDPREFTFPEMADPELYRQELKGQVLPRKNWLAGELSGFIHVDGDVELLDRGTALPAVLFL